MHPGSVQLSTFLPVHTDSVLYVIQELGPDLWVRLRLLYLGDVLLNFDCLFLELHFVFLEVLLVQFLDVLHGVDQSVSRATVLFFRGHSSFRQQVSQLVKTLLLLF